MIGFENFTKTPLKKVVGYLGYALNETIYAIAKTQQKLQIMIIRFLIPMK